jgi:hypothetical protein
MASGGGDGSGFEGAAPDAAKDMGGAAPSRRGVVILVALASLLFVVAFTGGVEAALHLYPRREFTRTWDEIARTRGKNQWLHEAALADETQRRVVRPNTDTLYSYAAIDMAEGPFTIVAPGSDRYWSIEFLADTTDVFGYVGSRDLGDRSGRVVLAPTAEGGAPAGLRVLVAPSRKVWLMARFLVDGPGDVERARRLQAELSIVPGVKEAPP